MPQHITDWQNDSETTYYQEAIAFRPNHSVEWQLRLERNVNDGWDWRASLEWPFCASAEGHEPTENAAKNAAESQLRRWRAWPPSPGRDNEAPFRANALVAFTTDSEKREYQAGTEVTVLEGLPEGCGDPEAYIVEVAIEDRTLVGEKRFDTAELKAVELERLR